MKEINVHECLWNMNILKSVAEGPYSDKERLDARKWHYLFKIIFSCLSEELHALPVATVQPPKPGAKVIEQDGTHWSVVDGTLLAHDDLDCLWYEVDVIDDDADVTLYYFDIRSACLAL